MKKNFQLSVAAVIAAAAVAAPAHAAYVVQDGWQIMSPVANAPGIGRLNVVSGSAVIEQQVNGLGQSAVGYQFKENGSIYGVTYTKENVAGAGDVGGPSFLGDILTMNFTNVRGHVTALNAGGGASYVFDSGIFTISGIGGTYATGVIFGIGGNASSTSVIGGFNGDSTILAQVTNLLNPNFSFKDSSGTSLIADMLAGDVLFQVVTNNNSTGFLGNGACSFDASLTCTSVATASGGDAYLVRKVPDPVTPVSEPSMLALVGMGLLGAGFTRRRRSSQQA